jgi:hypothetical protein
MNPIQQQILKAYGIEGMNEEQQKDAIEKIGGIIYQEVLMRVVGAMSDAEQDEFEALLDKDSDPETLFQFLKSKVPDLENIIKEETEKFRNESADIMSQIG